MGSINLLYKWETIEQLLEDSDLECLHHGRGTRIDVRISTALALILASGEVSGICKWDIWEESTIESDHYPVFITVHIDKLEEGKERESGYSHIYVNKKVE